MKWQNVKLIFSREVRDQLRDRRTLFTVAVMPMLLYPLMGMAMLQVSQFMQKHPTQVWMVGAENLPVKPALVVEQNINPQFATPGEETLVQFQRSPQDDPAFQGLLTQYRELSGLENGLQLANQMLQQELARRRIDVAVYFASPIELPKISVESNLSGAAPEVYVFHNSASDRSRVGAERINGLLSRWQSAYLAEVLVENELPITLVAGIEINHADVANKGGKRAAMWSKILPFIIVIWALTGAFYPAIDLCAGEKERGTFETLLSSPAARSEIALGKLLTVMSFSATTALLNLLSMGFTGMFVVAKLGGSMGMNGVPIGFPPLMGFFWLLVALLPIAALFSAVALAAAAFARSSKEGQYYLVPLMMISMPLMMVPMLPGSELNLGTSLIPISGLMLLLRGLIEGQYADCLRYVGPVCITTIICCWLSIRWVIHQFNSETVLFRASERFSVGAWLKFVMRERHELPSLGNALICGLLILVAKFFIGFVAHTPETFMDFAIQTVIILVATIGMPAVLMAMVLTRNPRKSLRLNGCSWPMASAAVLAAILLNPLFTWVTAMVMQVYPPGGSLMVLEQAIAKIMADAPGLWAVLLVFAVAPAIIEEIAFRGFILSGLESLRNKWQAILITSLLFGVAHSVIQQSIITFLVGMVIGVIAVQSRSIIPCMLFHAVHNSAAVLLSKLNQTMVESSPILSRLLVSEDGIHYQYSVTAGVWMTIFGLGMIVWFLKLPQGVSRRSNSSETTLKPALTPAN